MQGKMRKIEENTKLEFEFVQRVLKSSDASEK